MICCDALRRVAGEMFCSSRLRRHRPDRVEVVHGLAEATAATALIPVSVISISNTQPVPLFFSYTDTVVSLPQVVTMCSYAFVAPGSGAQ